MEHDRPAHSSPACLPLPRDCVSRGETSHPTAAGRQLQGKAGPGAPIRATSRAADIFLSSSGATTCTHPSLSFSEFRRAEERLCFGCFRFRTDAKILSPSLRTHHLKVRNPMSIANIGRHGFCPEYKPDRIKFLKDVGLDSQWCLGSRDAET